MPVNQITNPGAYSTETFDPSLMTETYIATGALIKGQLVQVVYTTVTPAKPIKVKKTVTTANFSVCGIVKTAVATGGIAQVVVSGIAKAAIKTNVVKDKIAVVTGTNAGYAKSGTTTAVLGKTVGVWLQTVTTSTGFALIYVKRC